MGSVYLGAISGFEASGGLSALIRCCHVFLLGESRSIWHLRLCLALALDAHMRITRGVLPAPPSFFS